LGKILRTDRIDSHTVKFVSCGIASIAIGEAWFVEWTKKMQGGKGELISSTVTTLNNHPEFIQAKTLNLIEKSKHLRGLSKTIQLGSGTFEKTSGGNSKSQPDSEDVITDNLNIYKDKNYG